MSEFIVINNATFGYKATKGNTTIVLDNINLSIDKGDFVAILGKNGCGKSTLAKHMNGIIVPNSGKVTVDGLDSSEESNAYEIRKKVGLVFQNPDNQIVASVVEEDVAFGPENLGVEPSEIRKRVDEALKIVGMDDYKKSSTYKLSGGQKQRVAIAGVLAMNSDCIVLDEPTSMLDPVGRAEVINTIIKLHKEKNTTIILITHYMEEALLASKVVIMDEGKIKLSGSPREVFKDTKKIKEVGLSLTQPMEILSRLNKHGYHFKTSCINEEECADEIVKYLEDKV